MFRKRNDVWIDRLIDRVVDLRKSTDERFDLVYKTLTSIDSRVNLLEGRVDGRSKITPMPPVQPEEPKNIRDVFEDWWAVMPYRTKHLEHKDIIRMAFMHGYNHGKMPR